MPATGPAHGEAADCAPSRVYRIMPLHLLHRLKHIDVARKFEGVAESPIQMKDKRILRRKFARGLLPVGKEFELREMIVAPMQPDIQTTRMVGFLPEACRHHQTVGLD